MNPNRRLAVLAVRAAAACAASLLLGLSGAQSVAAAPTLQLDAKASATVANDEMVVVLAVERDGQQLAPINEAVVSQLNAAIAEARRVEGVRARLGSLSTFPSFTREGKANGWRVRGEVVLESRMLQQLSQLTGRLSEKMQLASVMFRLSSERRRIEEDGIFQARPVYMGRSADAMPISASAPPPVPTDGGESEVVVSVSGTVDLMP